MANFDITPISNFTAANGDRTISVMTCRSVCSQSISITVGKDNIIRSVTFNGGCQGNTTGVAALCQGMTVSEAVRRLDGIDCGGRGTSCPDQLARALKTLV